MNLVTWIVAGALLGGAASALIGIADRRRSALNVAVGIAGVLLGGWLLSMLIGASAFSPGTFSLESLLVALLGAAVLLALLQEFRGAVVSRISTRQPSGRIPTNQAPGFGRALRPLITAGLTGILLLIGACASTPLALMP